MLYEQIIKSLETASPAKQRDALQALLKPHATPVFGASKVIEHEVAALQAFLILGVFGANPDEYDLVETLRITKNKARSLLYHAALRTESSNDFIEDSFRTALATCRPMRDGQFFMLEVPDPLTMDRLRKRVRTLGYLSDGSFVGSIAKVPEDALLLIIESLFTPEQREHIIQELHKAGMADKSVKGLLKAFIRQSAKKVAGETGDLIAKSIGEDITRLLKDGWKTLKAHAISS
ncbi:MAG: hypothetical protein AB1455_06475 [Pseudomonadota bacterium]